MSENRNREFATLGLIPRFEACKRIATEKLLECVSYLALKLYDMSKNHNREIASLCLIPRFEAVWHVKDSQQRIC